MATVPRSEMLRALVLELPERFLGSVARQTRTLWVYEDGAMVRRAVSYSPALYQLLDGALLTAARRNRDHTVGSTLKVDIDVQACRISMHTTAGGPPVSLDEEEEGVYIPELIYGRITNVDDPDDLAPKLPNLFSTEFVIEIADGRLRQKSYKQAFYDNMGKRSKPTTRKCAKSANWTRVTFKPDLPKFNMTELDADIVALMKRRVLDMAGTLGKKVTVELNGEKVPVRSFSDYVQLYIDSASKEGIELPRLYKKVNDCWEVCVTLSEGQFQQVSFVNGIATIRGGTHVNHVTDQITSHLMRVVNKKKHIHIGPHTVKDRLWIFVNALIDNPAFDSLTKEALTFGPECHLPQEFLKTVSKLIMGSNLLSCAESEPNTEVHRTDGSKGTGPLRIPKLEDANDAGGSESEQCTLILTEGESAKALAMAGLSVVGRDKYGVFPLRQCTMLNARGATSTQLRQSRELQSLMEIIGLQLDKDYDSPKDLRYGHLMIMTNQDCDGYHEKGLLINFIHSQWPSLLKAPSFLSEFITPMVKATNIRSEAVKSFYSMPDYETWKKNLGGNASAWSVKYYKGLGTSTAQECRDYFEDIAHHKKDFYWADEKDDEAIELAFDKGKTGERKDWLYNYQPGTCLDRHQKSITYSDFIHKELILFSMADIERSIPSVVDGFKRGQRKVMFCSFKRHLVKEIKVSQFVGFVSEHSAYQYGETSVAHTIIGMAQDFVGSNNISLLEPRGQFGTRNSGGKDAATPKYICTMLPRIARLIFPKDDDVLLNYLHEEGVSIEPSWYMPIIPMVLVNGAEGIGTGWSTFVPNYNPRDIISNLKRLLKKENLVPMDPWYKGFKGSVKKRSSEESGSAYTVTGVIEQVSDTKLRITELPIRRWTYDYKDFLVSSCLNIQKEKSKHKNKEPPFLEDFKSYCDHETVNFEVLLSEQEMNNAKQEGLEKKFKLTDVIGTTNMHLFDPEGKIRKYDTPEDILEEFFSLRLEFYARRKQVMLEVLEKELRKLENRVRFIMALLAGDIIVNHSMLADLLLVLEQQRYDPFPKKAREEPIAVGDTERNDVSRAVEGVEGVDAGGYEYLLEMAIGTLTNERVQRLNAERQRMEHQVEALRRVHPENLWMRDLDALEKELDVLDANGAGASKAAPKRQAAARSHESHVVPIPKRAAEKKKPPPRKASATERDDVVARLAACNPHPCPEPGARQAETQRRGEQELQEEL